MTNCIEFMLSPCTRLKGVDHCSVKEVGSLPIRSLIGTTTGVGGILSDGNPMVAVSDTPDCTIEPESLKAVVRGLYRRVGLVTTSMSVMSPLIPVMPALATNSTEVEARRQSNGHECQTVGVQCSLKGDWPLFPR